MAPILRHSERGIAESDLGEIFGEDESAFSGEAEEDFVRTWLNFNRENQLPNTTKTSFGRPTFMTLPHSRPKAFSSATSSQK